MKIFRLFLLVGFIVSSLFSCKNDGGEDSVDLYFDFSEELDHQIEALVKAEASVAKTVILDGVEEQGESFPGSVESWKNEFQVFYQADINKPNLAGLYEKRSGKDPNSNLTLTEYIAKEDDARVPYFSVAWLKDESLPVKIHARFVDANVGFTVSRELGMHYEEINKEFVISQYTIEGFQKVPGLDTVTYKIVAIIKR